MNNKTITVTEVKADGATVDKSGPAQAKVKVESLGLTMDAVEALIREKQRGVALHRLSEDL